MWRTMEILLKNVAYNGNPPPARKIYNPNPPTWADPRRSSAAGRENLQSKSASVGAAGAVGAVVVVATRESRLCRQKCGVKEILMKKMWRKGNSNEKNVAQLKLL